MRGIGRAGSPRFGAPIAYHLSNTPLRAKAANGVTGSGQASLLEVGRVGLNRTSNREAAPCRPRPHGTCDHHVRNICLVDRLVA